MLGCPVTKLQSFIHVHLFNVRAPDTRKSKNLHTRKKIKKTNFGSFSTRIKVINIWNTLQLEFKKFDINNCI